MKKFLIFFLSIFLLSGCVKKVKDPAFTVEDSGIYDTLEFVLEGESVEEAMTVVFEAESTEIIPAEVVEKKPFFSEFSDLDLIRVGVPADFVPLVKLIKSEKELELLSE